MGLENLIENMAGYIINPTKVLMGKVLYKRFCLAMDPFMMERNETLPEGFKISNIVTSYGDLVIEVVDEDMLAVK